MALIICADCQSQISDQAVACPKCGRPVQGSADGPIQYVTAAPEKLPSSKAWLWLIILPVVVFIVWAMAIANDPAAQARIRDREAIKLCWKEQERRSLTAGEGRFIAGACEGLEAKYRETHGREP